MKTRTKLLIPLFLVSLFVVGLTMSPIGPVKATMPDGPAIKNVYVTFEGWESITAGAMLQPKFLSFTTEMNLDHVNDTDPLVVSLTQDSFSELEEKPSNFKSTGITPTYSSDFSVTSYGLSSAAGIYQTLTGIPETDFTQHDYARHQDIYTWSTTESFSTTITNFMQALDNTHTYLNLTLTAVYATIVFDKDLVDDFFGDAAARPSFDEVASDADQTTNAAFVEILLDEVFGNHVSGIVYAPFNMTTNLIADSTWTPAKEVRSVLGGNATDDSLDGVIEIREMRNVLYGYIGQHLAAEVVIEGQGLPDPITSTQDPIYGFTQEATSYSVKFNILSDFGSSPCIANYTGLFGLFMPSEEALVIGQDVWFWGDSALIALMAAAGTFLAVLIVVYIPKMGLNTKQKWIWITGLTAAVFFVTFVMVLLATKLTYIG